MSQSCFAAGCREIPRVELQLQRLPRARVHYQVVNQNLSIEWGAVSHLLNQRLLNQESLGAAGVCPVAATTVCGTITWGEKKFHWPRIHPFWEGPTRVAGAIDGSILNVLAELARIVVLVAVQTGTPAWWGAIPIYVGDNQNARRWKEELEGRLIVYSTRVRTHHHGALDWPSGEEQRATKAAHQAKGYLEVVTDEPSKGILGAGCERHAHALAVVDL